jgi:LPXTG-motif cell wall-anchored protein
MSKNSSASGSLTRRATLKGAGLAVGTLWVAPLVQVISMESATAASAPPGRVQAAGGTTVASGPTSEGTLAQTGSAPAAGLAAAGVTAVAVGTGAVVAARRMRAKEALQSNE